MESAKSNVKTVFCPNCGSAEVYRSRRKGLKEFFLHRLFFISPYRCAECDYRHLRSRLPGSSNHPPKTRVA